MKTCLNDDNYSPNTEHRSKTYYIDGWWFPAKTYDDSEYQYKRPRL